MEVTQELTAKSIIYQLRAGKAVCVAGDSITSLKTLRSRVATLKGEEDKILKAVELLGDRQSLLTTLVGNKEQGWKLTMRLGDYSSD